MKNKMERILVAMITVIVLSTSNSQARESYAKEGAASGAVGVGLVFGLFGAAMSDVCYGADSCDNPSAIQSFLVGGLIGGAIGGAVGGLIGFAIPKYENETTSTHSLVQTRKDYRDRSALIGVALGAAGLGTFVGYKMSQIHGCDPMSGNMEMFCDTGSKVILTSLSTVGGGLVGAGIGSIIGSFIPKNTNIAIAPTFNPTPGALGGGVNLSLNF